MMASRYHPLSALLSSEQDFRARVTLEQVWSGPASQVKTGFQQLTEAVFSRRGFLQERI